MKLNEKKSCQKPKKVLEKPKKFFYNIFLNEKNVNFENRITQEEITMLKCFKNIDKAKTGIFAAGVLFGTAGIKILSSKDAKKLYTNCTAAVLRAKECVMKTATTIQENAEDIYAEAQQINEERAAQAAQEFDGEAEVTEAAAETADAE